MYARDEDDSRSNPLIGQPEGILVFALLEADPFALKDLWQQSLPIDLLDDLAAVWGTPLE
jgi:hypothetical protein